MSRFEDLTPEELETLSDALLAEADLDTDEDPSFPQRVEIAERLMVEVNRNLKEMFGSVEKADAEQTEPRAPHSVGTDNPALDAAGKRLESGLALTIWNRSPWDEWQATPDGKLDVRALFDRMAGESPVTYAARKEAEVERLRDSLEDVLATAEAKWLGEKRA